MRNFFPLDFFKQGDEGEGKKGGHKEREGQTIEDLPAERQGDRPVFPYDHDGGVEYGDQVQRQKGEPRRRQC